MGTKVQSKSYLPGYYSMRDLNEDSNSCSWPLYYGDKTLTNGQYYNGFLPRAIQDAYPVYDKDVVKQKMLEHEAIFKNQVFELHRLYRKQRDLMEEIKKKELHRNHIPAETSLSSSPLASQITSEDTRKWHIPSFPLANSVCGRPSISGVEDIHSPLSSLKGSTIPAGSFPCQNGDSSKDVEILDCRPTKVRRKMFDLHLPADEYIDTEEAEQLKDPGMSCHFPNGNGKIAPENDAKLFIGDGGKTGDQRDALRSDSCLRSANNLADLNEPVQLEEINGSAYADPLGHASSHGCQKLSLKQSTQLLVLPNEFDVNSYQRSNKSAINDLLLENNGTAKGLFSQVLEAGHSRINLKSAYHGFEPEKLPVSSQPVQVLFDKAHEPPPFLLTDQNKADSFRERTIHGLKISETNHESSKYNHMESIETSNIPSLNPFAASDLVKSLPHSVSSLEKPSISLSQKSVSAQTHPFFNSSGTFSKSSTISTQSNGSFGEKQHLNSNSRFNSDFVSSLANRNGFYYGSSSGSKEPAVHFPSASYSYLNCSNENSVVSENLAAHGSAKLYNSSNYKEIKCPKDVNLNVVLSNTSCNEPVLQPGPEIGGGRTHDSYLLGLPWLRTKPADCKNEATCAGSDLNTGQLNSLESSLRQTDNRNETTNGFSQMFTMHARSVSCSNNIEISRTEISECLSNKKIVENSNFEYLYATKNDSSLTSPSVSIPLPVDRREPENSGRTRFLDINLPCDVMAPDLCQETEAEIVVVKKEADLKISSVRNHIDLNLCVSEDEASFLPSVPDTCRKMTGGIDLEAPLVPEPEHVVHGEELLEQPREAPLQSLQPKDDCLKDEVVRMAAEAIVAISSSGQQNHLDDANCNSSESSMTDPLHWFVEVVSSFGEDLVSRFDFLLTGNDSGDQEEPPPEEIDYFESMILKLEEVKEEEYMPKSLIPENLIVEETVTNLLTNRPRKGQGRRGRQRRDFQRDILPGLASLSRHEVTEDLQIFGGLMRATGHLWHSGLTRRNSRNGSGRGRRRTVASPSPVAVAGSGCTLLVQQPCNNIEVGLEDRSLTGWGKTTRRPRRQRFPAGNPPSLPLT